MPVFFNGRLITSPGVETRIDDSRLVNTNPAVGNTLLLIGSSAGGEPNKALRIGSPPEAKALLRDGELLHAVKNAFNPSDETNAPATVIALRVNPATQSILDLNDATANTVIQLISTDYGIYTTQIRVKIENGTTKGKRVSTQLNDQLYTADNLARDLFTVQYTGAEISAQATVTDTQMTVEAPVGTVVATLDLTVHKTVQALVDALNAVPDITSIVIDNHGSLPSLNALDNLTGQDIKTAAITVRADLQEIINWFNGLTEGLVTATRPANGGVVPQNIPWTFLAGGTEGVITNADWSNAFTTAQSIDCQWLVPLSSDPAIHAMADAHAIFMSTVARQERRVFTGGALGQTIADVKAAAKLINSDRTSLCYPGFYNFDEQGKLVLFPPYQLAAIVGAAFAGSDPGEAMTNKSLNINGLETQLRNPTDTDDLIKGGVLAVEETTTAYKVVKSISTWLTDTNFNKTEVSVGYALDYSTRTVREAVQRSVGRKGVSNSLASIISRADTTLLELSKQAPQGPGVLAGDAQNPAYKGLTAKLIGDRVELQYECSPVIPINYILTTIYASPYNGSLAA